MWSGWREPSALVPRASSRIPAIHSKRMAPTRTLWEPFSLVGVAGFEPTASSSRTKRATKLRHTPAHLANSASSQATAIVYLARERIGLSGDAVNVSSVASGRQANRTGAYGDVPRPAHTCTVERLPASVSHVETHRARDGSRSQLLTSAP